MNAKHQECGKRDLKAGGKERIQPRAQKENVEKFTGERYANKKKNQAKKRVEEDEDAEIDESSSEGENGEEDDADEVSERQEGRRRP